MLRDCYALTSAASVARQPPERHQALGSALPPPYKTRPSLLGSLFSFFEKPLESRVKQRWPMCSESSAVRPSASPRRASLTARPDASRSRYFAGCFDPGCGPLNTGRASALTCRPSRVSPVRRKVVVKFRKCHFSECFRAQSGAFEAIWTRPRSGSFPAALLPTSLQILVRYPSSV
jgi:hypothetical protein